MAQKAPAQRQQMTGAERLGLRVSAMINHPLAQVQRWVTIHQLDTDAQEDWDAILEVLASTDGIDLTFHDDGSVTVKWEAQESDEPTAAAVAEDQAIIWDRSEEEEAVPF
ncbi:DUF1654 domain-containing protein [Pseudomonas eucalypticola]|uniref:DUF1654 domain-containing protein n=2 Tax=Pseudomonas eucalypticola TaxID=2599595 RepID=A0A7D5DC31_9PSED|nr:DUF1654 domain-containing protein [Pseudomonas eucalypticola]